MASAESNLEIHQLRIKEALEELEALFDDTDINDTVIDIALDTDDSLLRRSGELQDTIIEAAMQAAFWSEMLGLDGEGYLELVDETLASKQAIWCIVNNNR